MSGELISRRDALEALGEEPPVWCDSAEEIVERNQWRRDVNAIKAVPPAEPKTGKWLPCYVDTRLQTYVFKCSYCGVQTYTRLARYIDCMDYAYCPYCGAQMEAGD